MQMQEWIASTPIDFVLSNLHWGTRWDYYVQYGLDTFPKVLIDGDDSRHGRNWYNRYTGWRKVYPMQSGSEVLWNNQLYSRRFMVPLHGYTPDVVFSAQKAPNDRVSHYLPFGIHNPTPGMVSADINWIRPFCNRDFDFTNIPGDGGARTWITGMVSGCPPPGCVSNEFIHGPWRASKPTREAIALDKNIHSWHRWRFYSHYWKMLGDSRTVINPGVFIDLPQWDSKRPWEALAMGAHVLHREPNIDMSSYPVTALSDYSTFVDYPEMIAICRELISREKLWWRLEKQVLDRAWKYFGPAPLARRFLQIIKESL